MKSYFSVCSSKLFWIKETLMHRGLNEAWKKCMAVEEGSQAELERLREAKLARVLRHAATTVPFYRDYFASKGIDVDKVKLADFPIIEKKDIRGNEKQFVSTANGMPRISWDSTSGSTGEPFRFGRSEFTYTYATLWRGMLRFGIRPGDKRVLVKGVDITPQVSLKTRLRRWAYGQINHCINVDAHFLSRSDENVVRELKRIIAYGPKYLHGYANSIYVLARTAEQKGIDLAKLKVKAVVTESEKCHDFQREVMERVFKAPVVENYGCVELGMIAQPAPDGKLCINDDHVFVEALPDGEALLTNLDEYGFPLIRYKNGDLLKLGARHGLLPYGTIAKLDGRSAESIILPSGASLQGYLVMYPVYLHSKYIKSYQIFQPDVHHLFLRYVPTDVKMPDSALQQIRRDMLQLIGAGVTFEIVAVQTIPLTKRGKHAFVCSNVGR